MSVLCVLPSHRNFFSRLHSYCNRRSIAFALTKFSSHRFVVFRLHVSFTCVHDELVSLTFFFNNYTFSAALTASHTLTIRGIRDR